jgi:hypothetical protein
MFTTHGAPVLQYAVERITEIIIGGWTKVARADALLLAETTVRLAVTVAAMPDGPARLNAQRVATLFAPFIEKILTAAYPEGW